MYTLEEYFYVTIDDRNEDKRMHMSSYYYLSAQMEYDTRIQYELFLNESAVNFTSTKGVLRTDGTSLLIDRFKLDLNLLKYLVDRLYRCALLGNHSFPIKRCITIK